MGNLLDGLILVTRRGDLIFSWGSLKELNEVCTVSETVNVINYRQFVWGGQEGKIPGGELQEFLGVDVPLGLWNP